MIRNALMLVLCAVVVAAMFLILRWFLRRLTKIEDDMWGEKARAVGRYRQKRHAD